MKQEIFTSQEVDDIALALGMRICYIETGTVTLRASDAITQGKSNLIKPLSDEQQRLILRLVALRTKAQEQGNPCRQIKF